jgi:hypothetical protein
MEITIKQVEALDYQRLVNFISTLSLVELEMLKAKFNKFITVLFANKLETAEIFSKTMAIMIEINTTIDDRNGLVDTSNGKILKVVK